MIRIHIGEPKKLSDNIIVKKSAFISFPYKAEIINYIKNMSIRKYDPDTHVWEVPINSIIGFCNKFEDENITISGVYEDLDSERFNAELPPGFTFKTKPFPHQIDGVRFALKKKKFLLCDDQGLGKALALDTKIYTPDGYKCMRDIQVGDYVFNKSGVPTKVTATYNHKNVEMYRITFSDGCHIDCCKDHLWEINSQHGRKKVIDTKWLTSKDQFGKYRNENLFSGGSYKFWIDRCNPVQFNKKDVLIDPYVLGCLLGDGSISGGSISFTSKDFEIINEINNRLPQGYFLHSSDSMTDIDFNIVKKDTKSSKENIVKTGIKNLGLYGTNSHTKFIPDCYKYNCAEYRLLTLQGLIDTDGYTTKDNLVQYTTVSKQLCDDVRFLVESLGGIVSYTETECGYNDKITGIAYTLTIKHDNPQLLCRLSRKKNLLHPRKFKTRRNIVKVEKIQNADAKCITVDSPDHLYLAEHFIVTHNTKQIIDFVSCLEKTDTINKVLIICGVNSLKYNWQSEISTHSDEKGWVLGTRFRKTTGKAYEGSTKDKLEDLDNLPDCRYIITNIETLRGGAKKISKSKYNFPVAEKLQELCKKGIISVIAFDECHKSKDPTSLQSRAMSKLSSTYMVAMSGTPLMNNPLDLYFPLHWLGYEQHSFYQFKQHFCRFGGWGGSEVVGYKNLGEIRALMDELMLRRLKAEVLDLPEKIHQTEFVDMTPKQKKIYNEAVMGVKNNINKIRMSNNPLSMMIRLRQATGWTGILSDTVTESAKMERMLELVEDLAQSNQKCIIFSNWSEITQVAKQLLKKYNPAYITGETKSEERMQEIYRFQNDDNCKVIIGTIGAMGTGLTLTAAQTVIFLDSPWNRALKDQAEDRAHRIGTKGTVNIITLCCRDTIDERIEDIVYKKGAMSDALVDGKISIQDINYLIS
jgi:superfamily II DNA or RNA helicase